MQNPWFLLLKDIHTARKLLYVELKSKYPKKVIYLFSLKSKSITVERVVSQKPEFHAESGLIEALRMQ